MQLTEQKNGISNTESLRESTRILRRNGRSGAQQLIDRGFGKARNTDFEPLHYMDN